VAATKPLPECVTSSGYHTFISYTRRPRSWVYHLFMAIVTKNSMEQSPSCWRDGMQVNKSLCVWTLLFHCRVQNIPTVDWPHSFFQFAYLHLLFKLVLMLFHLHPLLPSVHFLSPLYSCLLFERFFILFNKFWMIGYNLRPTDSWTSIKNTSLVHSLVLNEAAEEESLFINMTKAFFCLPVFSHFPTLIWNLQFFIEEVTSTE
jgi:hypothetical protein